MAEGHESKQSREAFEAAEQNRESAVPGADAGGHPRSHAAHPETEGNVRTIPEGYGKQGREPGTLNQPPQDPRSSVKAVRRQ